MVITLENLHIEGASLEPTLIERIKNEVKEIEKISKQDSTKVKGRWENFLDIFLIQYLFYVKVLEILLCIFYHN